MIAMSMMIFWMGGKLPIFDVFFYFLKLNDAGENSTVVYTSIWSYILSFFGSQCGYTVPIFYFVLFNLVL